MIYSNDDTLKQEISSLFKSTLFQGTGFAWESLFLLECLRYTGIQHSPHETMVHHLGSGDYFESSDHHSMHAESAWLFCIN